MNTHQRPIPVRPDRNAIASEWRRSFVNEATIKSLALIRKSSFEEVALELRAPVSAMKVSAFPGGDAIGALLALAPDTALSEILSLAIKVDMRGVSSLSLPVGGMGEAHFVEEGFPIPVVSGSFTGLPIEAPKKCAVIAPLTNELESYSAPTASVVISNLLRTAVSNGVLKVLLSAGAETAAAPAGLLNGVVGLTADAGGSAAKDLQALVGAIAASGIDTRSIAFICAPAQAMALQMQPWPNFDHEVIEAATLADGVVIAIATDGFVVAGEGTPEVSASKHGVFHMNDVPANIGTAGTPPVVAAQSVSMYQVDSFALRCVCRLTWSIAPGAVAHIVNTVW